MKRYNSNEIVRELDENLFSEDVNAASLLDCQRLDLQAVKRAPLRVRIIFKGLASRAGLEEVNALLAANGCPALYARSFLEATLIYALTHGMDFTGWLRVMVRCGGLRESQGGSQYFRDGRITYGELRRYVLENSEAECDEARTSLLTRRLSAGLAGLPEGEEELLRYLEDNLAAFSPVREKTRYYFCKYLYGYLSEAVDGCLSHRGGSSEEEYVEALGELVKVQSYLERNRSATEKEVLNQLDASSLSLRGIFDNFNYFYGESVTAGWPDLLDEAYIDGEVPDAIKRKYLKALGRGGADADANRLDREFSRAVREREAELDERGGERCGEAALRKYLRGELDIDRTTLLSFLLFFSGSGGRGAARDLTAERVDGILRNCGYPALDPGAAFDGFISGALNCRSRFDLMSYVEGAVAGSVRKGENSPFYRAYRKSVSYAKQFESSVR